MAGKGIVVVCRDIQSEEGIEMQMDATLKKKRKKKLFLARLSSRLAPLFKCTDVGVALDLDIRTPGGSVHVKHGPEVKNLEQGTTSFVVVILHTRNPTNSEKLWEGDLVGVPPGEKIASLMRLRFHCMSTVAMVI